MEYIEPTTVEEALALLAGGEGEARPLGGGTAVMLLMKYGFLRPSMLVGLRRLAPDLGGISRQGSHELRLGALASLRDLELSPDVQRSAPVLVQALHVLANVRVRNAATLGGHLAHADPHQDLPPVLLAMGARARIAGANGPRTIGLGELIVGYYETALGPGELITEIVLPEQRAGVRGSYTKFTAISAEDWPALGIAVFLGEEDGRLSGARLALSAVTERPRRLEAVETMLEGERPTPALFSAAADAAARSVDPLPDGSSSLAYKREMVRVHVRRALERTMQAPARGAA